MGRIQLDKKDSGASHKMKHIRIYSEPPKKNNFLESLGWLALMALFGGALFWGLDTSLRDMTIHDCEVNKIEAACRDLKK